MALCLGSSIYFTNIFQAWMVLCLGSSIYEGNSISIFFFVITAIIYELTAIYGFLNVSADTDKNKLYIASSILA